MEKTKLHTYIVIIGQSSNVMVLIEKHARFCLICVAEGDEMKRRMYSSIVVVGGGLAFAGTQSWLENLIWTQMPPQIKSTLETMDVHTMPKV